MVPAQALLLCVTEAPRAAPAGTIHLRPPPAATALLSCSLRRCGQNPCRGERSSRYGANQCDVKSQFHALSVL